MKPQRVDPSTEQGSRWLPLLKIFTRCYSCSVNDPFFNNWGTLKLCSPLYSITIN
jgi:hypothetical protein